MPDYSNKISEPAPEQAVQSYGTGSKGVMIVRFVDIMREKKIPFRLSLTLTLLLIASMIAVFCTGYLDFVGTSVSALSLKTFVLGPDWSVIFLLSVLALPCAWVCYKSCPE